MSGRWGTGAFPRRAGWRSSGYPVDAFGRGRSPAVPIRPDTARALGRAGLWLLCLLWPIAALVHRERLHPEPYPQLDLGTLACAPGAGPAELTFVFDDSGSMGWNDPYNRRYEEARQLARWWRDEGCDDQDRIAVVHFDDAIPAVAPVPADTADLDSALRPTSSSSDITGSIDRALGWAGKHPGKDIILLFTDGENPDVTDALARLRAQPEPHIIFVSLGHDLPPDWRDPVIDDVVPVGVVPPLGSVSIGTSETIKELLEP